MSDIEKLRGLDKRYKKLCEERQKLMDERAYELHLSGTGDMDLALEDRNSVLPVFPEEYDPDHKLRNLSDEIDAVKSAYREEEKR